jgi:glycerophosphoryl diester phosphodiesterase
MFSWREPHKRPIIVAHRGSSAIAPENTLAAFQRAVEGGADAVELDIRLTSDGEVVVFHDSQLRRTTNGRGRVEEHTLASLKELSAGRWFNRSFSSEKIPTLGEVLELLRRRVGVNIEIKTDLRRRRYSEIVQRCCNVIQQHHAESYVLVSSFHHAFVREMKRKLPSVATGMLFHPFNHVGRSAMTMTAQAKADYMFFGGETMRKAMVNRAHHRGVSIGEFTVNTPRRFARALRYGVDADITDDPALLLRLRSQLK